MRPNTCFYPPISRATILLRRIHNGGWIVRNRILGTILVLFAVSAIAQLGGTPTQSPNARGAQIAAGRYIVENVAMCSTCHTQRTSNGEFLKGRHLMGGRLAFKVPQAGRWADEAPQIAGLPRWEDEEIVILLTTGKLETGLTMRPPMPQFRMSKQDAEAVVAYLRSIAPPKRSAKARGAAGGR
jgi:mono/diheme cytochrome c family protein